jgi:hypothetical protein
VLWDLRAIVGLPLLHRDQCPPWLDDRVWFSFCHHADRKDEKQLNFGSPNQEPVSAVIGDFFGFG